MLRVVGSVWWSRGTPNYAFKPIAEQALRSIQTIVPQRLNAALGVYGGGRFGVVVVGVMEREINNARLDWNALVGYVSRNRLGLT